MIGIDSNVLIRMMADDDVAQGKQVRTFLLKRTIDDPAYVSAVVLAETVWVLQSRLGYASSAIVSALRRLLESGELKFQHTDRLAVLLDGPAAGRGDLADHVIAWSAAEAGCTHTVTFDRKAARFVPGMELLA